MMVIAQKEFLMLIAEKGYSAEELAKKIGVSRLTIYNVIKRKPIRTGTAKKLCIFFEVNMMDYFELVLDET
ncbi:MAG: helix-turn-helix domain-containing protein [Blautia hansenii]